jgi:hypothetical protein
VSAGAADRLRVDPEALGRARTALTTAAKDVADTGGSSPGSVDAGDMTGPVSALIGALSESAAGLAEGLHAAGQKVGDNATSYVAAEEHAASGFRPPRGAAY